MTEIDKIYNQLFSTNTKPKIKISKKKVKKSKGLETELKKIKKEINVNVS